MIKLTTSKMSLEFEFTSEAIDFFKGVNFDFNSLVLPEISKYLKMESEPHHFTDPPGLSDPPLLEELDSILEELDVKINNTLKNELKEFEEYLDSEEYNDDYRF